MARILVVDDEGTMLSLLTKLFASQGHECETALDGMEALELLEHNQYDLLTCDVRMPNMDGLELLHKIRLRNIEIPIVMITAYPTVKDAVYALSQNVYDFIIKPFKFEHLLEVIEGALAWGGSANPQSQNSTQVVSAKLNKYGVLVAHSPGMLALCQLIDRIGPSVAPVLIHGEPGYDQESIAKAIHMNSMRSNEPFILLNCEDINSADFYKCLFGRDKEGEGEVKGAFERAHKGTLMLSSAHRLSRDAQQVMAKCLIAHSNEDHDDPYYYDYDVRLLIGECAYSAPMHVKLLNLHPDLIPSRVKVQVRVPPLRDRRPDMLPLLAHYIKSFSKHTPVFSNDACAKLTEYEWPGNEDELKMTAEYMASSVADGIFQESSLPDHISAIQFGAEEAIGSPSRPAGSNIRRFLDSQGVDIPE